MLDCLIYLFLAYLWKRMKKIKNILIVAPCISLNYFIILQIHALTYKFHIKTLKLL